MSRNLRNKRRANRCRILARKAIRNPRWGTELAAHEEADARHIAKGGGYILYSNQGCELRLKPRSHHEP